MDSHERSAALHMRRCEAATDIPIERRWDDCIWPEFVSAVMTMTLAKDGPWNISFEHSASPRRCTSVCVHVRAHALTRSGFLVGPCRHARLCRTRSRWPPVHPNAWHASASSGAQRVAGQHAKHVHVPCPVLHALCTDRRPCRDGGCSASRSADWSVGRRHVHGVPAADPAHARDLPGPAGTSEKDHCCCVGCTRTSSSRSSRPSPQSESWSSRARNTSRNQR